MVNSALQRLIGLPREEIYGRTALELYAGEVGAKFHANDISTVRSGGTEEFEEVMEGPDGPRTFLTRKTPIKDEAGDVEALLGVSREITERKLTEQIIRRLALAVSNIGDGVRVTDTDGRIEFANPALERMLGYEKSDLVGTHMSALYPQGADNPVLREIMEAMSDGGWTGEVELLGKDGDRVPTLEHATPLRDEAELVVGYVCANTDISELKQAEEALRLTSRLASIGELAAGVAHEINNPVNSIMGFTEMLIEDDLPEQARSDLERVYADAQRASRIVDNLLSFARQRDAQRQLVDVAAIVDRTLELKSYDFQLNKIKVDKQLSPSLPQIEADGDQLVEVILNVLNNAEYEMVNANGGGRLRIRTGRAGSMVRITVEDDGPGMTPEVEDKIFDPFFTTKPVDKGTGLGLSICYGLVSQHGGRIWAETEPGKGATFHIELPLDERNAEAGQP